MIGEGVHYWCLLLGCTFAQIFIDEQFEVIANIVNINVHHIVVSSRESSAARERGEE